MEDLCGAIIKIFFKLNKLPYIIEKIKKSSTGRTCHWKGKKRPEHSKKISGINHHYYGKKNPTLSKFLTGRKRLDILGDKHPNWKGGTSYEPYCEQWLDKEYKESIKERDGYICLNPECNKTRNTLCVHHINYIKKDCSPFNLITVCGSCNTKANKDREWHKSWYQTIIYNRYFREV